MTPTDTLPPLVEQILAYAAILLALLTALAHGIVWLVPRLRVIASRTKTHRDDAVVDWLARAGASLAAVLDVVQLFVPRVALGRPSPSLPETSTSTVTRTDTPPTAPPPMTGPGGAAVVLLALASLSLLAPMTSGCGGAQVVSAGATCGTMMQLIATRADYTAERASSDLDSQRSICERLTAPVAVAP